MIKLGQRVKDVVTGFEGIATSRAEYLHGCARVTVQPVTDKDGKIPECEHIDEPQLEVTKKSQVLKSKKPKQLIKLGQKVIDPVSKLEGIAIGRCVYINGCARVVIVPELDADGKFQGGTWFDEPQLQAVAKKIEVPSGSRTTGGPAPCNPNRSY